MLSKWDKYYDLINDYIDDYIDKNKIRPSNLGKYFKSNQKLLNLANRIKNKHTLELDDMGLENLKKIITSIIDDRVAMEKDGILKFERFKFYESNEFKILDFKQCLYKGVDKVTIEHEKILADHFDVSLSAIDVIDSDKHIFKIDTLRGDIECVIYTNDELDIIKENMVEHFFNQVFNKSVKIEGVSIDINVNLSEFIDETKFQEYAKNLLTIDKVKEIVINLLDCEKMDDNSESLIGINPNN
jgi:hypothetical protein